MVSAWFTVPFPPHLGGHVRANCSSRRSREGQRRLRFALVGGAMLCLLLSGGRDGSARSADIATESKKPAIEIQFETDRTATAASESKVVQAEILTEAADGGVLLRDRTGRMWAVSPRQVSQRMPLAAAFAPFTPEELSVQLKEELGSGGEVIITPHYVIYSEAGRNFGQWVGRLFERLMAAFKTHWDRRPLQVNEPRFPLVVIVLKDQARYVEYALKDAGPSAIDALGYYSQLHNRVVMYDLTAGGPPPRNEIDVINRLLGQTQNVSTIVHEATHQIAFNCGLHNRLADNPVWLVEGMAMYFETPDLKNQAGWQKVGQLNAMRMRDFREYVTTSRPANALRTLIVDDQQFQNAETALDAYSEAWALTYYLIKTHRTEYVKYLEKLTQRQLLKEMSEEERVEEFEEYFGKLDLLEKEFFKYMGRQVSR